ncbi:Non-specific serine/threonine protein kinase [Bertholletia excelsa]
MPQTNPNYFTSATYVDDGDEVSIMYNFSIWSPFVLDEMGSLHWHHFDEGLGTWIDIKSFPEDPCEQYGRCGSYGICGPSSTGVAPKCTCPPGYEPRSARDSSVQNGTEGCVRKRRPVSECDKGDGFFMLAKARLPDVLQAQYHAKLSPETCQKTCLKNCSCTAYSAGGGVECITWHGDLNDIGVLTEGGHDLHIRVDSIELAPSKKTKSSHRKKEAIVVGSIAGVLLLIICLVCWLVLKRRREARLNMLLASEEHNLELPIFDFATIVRATNNFSIENKIGEGGFGPVYKAQRTRNINCSHGEDV